jgi:AraC family transcriptional regulator, positive regulator of tynA and feaB
VQTIFSTADVPRAEAFAYWADVVRANLTPMHRFELLDRTNFRAELRRGIVADLTFVSWQASPAYSSGGGSDELSLVLPSSRALIEIGGRQFESNRDSLCLIDHREASAACSPEPIDRTFVRIPREALERRIRLANVVNRPLPVRGDLALLAAFLREIVRIGPSSLSLAAAALVREQMLDLTAAAIGNLAGITPRFGAAQRVGTLRLRAAIENQLANSDANRQSIAAVAGICERHANRLLALEGTSIRRLLIERRLARCRAAFEDPLQRHRSIGDIALACGFRNLSHFTLAFKNRFGLTPGEYRSAFVPGGPLKSHTAK